MIAYRDHGSYARPAVGLAALAVMVGWTCVTVTAYRHPAGRTKLQSHSKAQLVRYALENGAG